MIIMSNTTQAICLASILLLWSCGNSATKKQEGPTTAVELELVDSLVVDELEPLVMDDHLARLGYFMLRNTKSRQPLLVDDKGTVLQRYDILNDGPNGIGSFGTGYRLLDESGWVAQNLMTGYYVYDYQGNRQKELPANRAGLFSISIYTNRTTFNPFLKNGKAHIVGEEPNAFDHKEISAEKLGAVFYDQAKTLFDYDVASEEVKMLPTFPDEWEPKSTGRYVGPSFPLVAINRKSLQMAILPTVGNQLFIYDYSGDEPLLVDSVRLTHRYRPDDAPEADLKAARWLEDYPLFTDLRVLGDGFLVGFFTRIPAEVMKQLRAKSEEYYKLPEYQEANDQYAKPHYLLVRGGKQVGVIDELPVHGVIDFADEEGYMYINDNQDPEVERDYNVFYKVKVKE